MAENEANEEMPRNVGIKPEFKEHDVNRFSWFVPPGYNNLKPYNSYTSGRISSAVKDGKEVAIKKIASPHDTADDVRRTTKELRTLQYLKHKNVLEILDVFTPSTGPEFFEVYFVHRLMATDLYSVIKNEEEEREKTPQQDEANRENLDNKKVVTFSEEHVKLLVFQILRGLEYIHSSGVVHFDLKPTNIFVNENCELKIADIGLVDVTKADDTDFISRKWYRAPEVLLQFKNLDDKVDIWSVGCIMTELLSLCILFPGTDHIDLLLRIFFVRGSPHQDDEFMKRIIDPDSLNFVNLLPTDMQKKDLREIIKEKEAASDDALEIIDKMLEIRSDVRWNATQLMNHPYFEEFKNHMNTNLRKVDRRMIERDLEEENLTRLKEMLFKEIEDYNKSNN